MVVDWVAPGVEEGLPAIAALDALASRDAEILAPRLLLEEVSNALITGIRRRPWNGAQADAAHALLLDLPVRLIDQPSDLVRAWDLARRFDDHPIYDMLYVAVAERRGTQLVTADASLQRRLVGFDWIVGPDRIAG